MSKPLDRDCLEELVRAANKGIAHPLDIIRLVEEIWDLNMKMLFTQFPNIPGYQKEYSINKDGMATVEYTQQSNLIEPTIVE